MIFSAGSRLVTVPLRAGAAAALSIGLIGLGTLTWAQTRTWHDALTFWSYAVSVSPSSGIAHGNLGSQLGRAGRLREAREHLELAVTLRPNYVEALSNLAQFFADTNQPDKARATLRRMAYALGNHGKLDRAIDVFQGLVDIDPKDAVAHNGLGVTLYLRGDRDRAAEHFRRAVTIDPGYAEARANLAFVGATRTP